MALVTLVWVLSLFYVDVAGRSLFLYDDETIPQSHSQLLTFLLSHSTESGLEKQLVTNGSFTLFQFAKRTYDNVFLLLSRTNQLVGKLNLKAFLDFVDDGGNLFLAVGPSCGGDVAKLVTELGFLTSSRSFLIDHANFVPEDTGKHTRIVIDSTAYAIKSEGIFKSPLGPLLYEGTGFALDTSNPLTFTILSAPQSAYLAFPDSPIKEFPLAIGTNVVLMGGLEMRNRARAVVLGSSSFTSNQLQLQNVALTDDANLSTSTSSLSPPGNLAAIEAAINWCFQKQGVLRITNPKHQLIVSGQTLSEYVVDTMIEYSITLEELAPNHKWIPYVANDLQLELVRLTIFSRLIFNHTGNGLHTARFYIPDYIGTYKLETRYHRPGYTSLNHHTKIVVRPRRHNDYQRFLPGAWPYYASSFLMMILTFSLVFFLLNQRISQKMKEC